MKIFEFNKIFPQIPNMIFRRRLRFEFELIPFEADNLSLKKRLNFFFAGLNQFLLLPRPLGYPVIGQVEPANFCNLSCPLCLTTSENNSRPKAYLSYEVFKAFIDQFGDYLLLIVLWNWGEPFLNPNIFRIISYAKKKNILIHSSTNGNLNFAAEKADSLVKSGLDSLIIAVDGATQETYGKFRKKGRLELVLKTIENIIAAKNRANSLTPKITIRTVVTKHNEKELSTIRRIAENLNVDFFTIKTVAMTNKPSGDHDKYYIPENQKYRMYEYDARTLQRKKRAFVCMRPWKRITLDALGEVIPCEFDYKNLHSFGGIGKTSPINVWKSDQSKEFRKYFNKGNNSYYLCRDCLYKDRVADDCTVERII